MHIRCSTCASIPTLPHSRQCRFPLSYSHMLWYPELTLTTWMMTRLGVNYTRLCTHSLLRMNFPNHFNITIAQHFLFQQHKTNKSYCLKIISSKMHKQRLAMSSSNWWVLIMDEPVWVSVSVGRCLPCEWRVEHRIHITDDQQEPWNSTAWCLLYCEPEWSIISDNCVKIQIAVYFIQLPIKIILR